MWRRLFIWWMEVTTARFKLNQQAQGAAFEAAALAILIVAALRRSAVHSRHDSSAANLQKGDHVVNHHRHRVRRIVDFPQQSAIRHTQVCQKKISTPHEHSMSRLNASMPAISHSVIRLRSSYQSRLDLDHASTAWLADRA
jgi:hypothetical protein